MNLCCGGVGCLPAAFFPQIDELLVFAAWVGGGGCGLVSEEMEGGSVGLGAGCDIARRQTEGTEGTWSW